MKSARFVATALTLLGVIQFTSCSKNTEVDATSSETASGKDCSALEPSNPYEEGSGHHAGFKWGEDGHACGGNSTSFIEGCEEFEAQEEAYNTCVSKEKK
jgi:hypothetical protein